MKLSILSLPAMIATCCIFCACTVQTGTTPETVQTDSGALTHVSSAAVTSSITTSSSALSGALVEGFVADPAPTTTDSLEVPAQDQPTSVTGHLLVSTIGFGNTPEKDGPPRMLELFDYDCEYCRQHAQQERRWIDEAYVAKGSLGIERIFVTMTPAGKRMGQAALCAGVQNVFPAMDAFLLSNVPQTDPPIFAFAKTLSIDQAQFKTCMQNMSVAEGSYTLPDGTVIDRIPAFSIGTTIWSGIVPQGELKTMIDKAIRDAK